MPKLRIAGWIMSVLFVGMMIFSASMKLFIDWEGKEKAFTEMGYSLEVMQQIGIVELIIAILFLIPQTSFVAAILLSAYLGGAVNTHIQAGDPVSQFGTPILLGVFMWVAYGFRRPEIFKLAVGKRVPLGTNAEGKT